LSVEKIEEETSAQAAHTFPGSCEIGLKDRFQPNAFKDFQRKSLKKEWPGKGVCCLC